MEFVIKREVFLEGLQRTLGIVEKKTTTPILSNVFIKTENDGIKIVATDRELTLLAKYDANILQEGAVTVLGRKLYELIRECDGDDVHLSSNEKCLVTVTCGKAIFKIYGISAENYPNVTEGYEELFRIDSDVLREMIAKTQFAVSNDERRKNLTGVFLRTEKEQDRNLLVMVATDGNRLSYMQKVVPEGFLLELDKGIIIPKRSLGEIRKMLDGGKDVYIGYDQRGFIIKRDNIILRVSTIDEQYPNYKRVIPTEFDSFMIFNRGMVLSALRRVSVLADDEYNAVTMKLGSNTMHLHAVNQNLGEADDSLEVKYEGEEWEKSFNVVYLIEAINAIDDEDVIFCQGSVKKQCLIRSVVNDECKFIVMPLKV